MAHEQTFTETEVKLYVPDLDRVRARLEQLGAALTKPRLHEINTRYEDASGTLTSRGVVVRLRQDDGVRITYKEGGETTPDTEAHARFEAETSVGDFETMQLILRKLGYFPAWRYEKYRTTYAFDTCEVVLDEMPYGSFVEIEGERDAIRRVRAALELNDAPNFRAGYGELFARVKAYLSLTAHDLTFDNFAGVAVPAAAFEG